MGTSNSNKGPGGGKPLIPTWLAGGDGLPPPPAPPQPPPDSLPPADPAPPPAPPPQQPPPKPPLGDRFRAPRSNLSRFARSGGQDRQALRKAASQYVSQSAGGPRRAVLRMGPSRTAGAVLLGFLSDARASGVQQALQRLNLQALAGKPIDEILTGIADYACHDSGSIDEAIARDAFFETIADLSELGITDINALTADQLELVFEVYATHAIEARICNDIGMKAITYPTNLQAAENVQRQIREYIQGSVHDALTGAKADFKDLTRERALQVVDDVYESAFKILQALGEGGGSP